VAKQLVTRYLIQELRHFSIRVSGFEKYWVDSIRVSMGAEWAVWGCPIPTTLRRSINYILVGWGWDWYMVYLGL
jgi:hypothetical protein